MTYRQSSPRTRRPRPAKYGAAARPCPGQLALPVDTTRTARPERRRPARAVAEQPELDVGPVVRRKRPLSGPAWPPFEAVRATDPEGPPDPPVTGADA